MILETFNHKQYYIKRISNIKTSQRNFLCAGNKIKLKGDQKFKLGKDSVVVLIPKAHLNIDTEPLWRHTVSVLTKLLRFRKEEVGQRKACTFKTRLPQAGKPARKLDKQA